MAVCIKEFHNAKGIKLLVIITYYSDLFDSFPVRIIGFVIGSIDPNFLHNTSRNIYFEVRVISKQNIRYNTLIVLKK